MYCTECGKQIAENDAFCPYCGTPAFRRDALAGYVASARSGDQDAIAALYEKTYSKVFYTVKSMIKDEDAVFDIVQDTYVKAFAHLDQFQGNTKFLPWVKQIAANTARDWLKKKKPMLFTEMSTGEEQDTPVEELFPDERSEHLPDQVIDQNETTRLIREIIEDLPEDQRAAVGMFYYEEMSVKEIATAMGASESAVKSRLMYARKKIEKKVRELEKQGTKLYGLAPIPFLLLLLRSQDAYAAEAPDGRILQNILQSTARSASAAEGVGASRAAGRAAGSATRAGAAGSSASGTAAAVSGGLSAAKIAIIILAVVAVIEASTLGAMLVRRSRETPPSVDEPVYTQEVQETPSVTPEEPEPTPEEEPVDEAALAIEEALEQYRVIISQADSYDYQSYGTPVSYRYALVQMRPDDPVPTLLLEMETAEYINFARVFQYDPDTKTVRQPTDVLEEGVAQAGGFRGSIGMAGDGNGIGWTVFSSGTGETTVTRVTFSGDSLAQSTMWEGRIDQMPDTLTFIDIEWHEIWDLSALESWTPPEPGEAEPPEPSVLDDGALPTDGNRTVLTGTVRAYNYRELAAQQGLSDAELQWTGYDPNRTYYVIVLDTPQTLRLVTVENDYFSNTATMIYIFNTSTNDVTQYVGQHVIFSIDPARTEWPSDVSLPVGEPSTSDIHILG